MDSESSFVRTHRSSFLFSQFAHPSCFSSFTLLTLTTSLQSFTSARIPFCELSHARPCLPRKTSLSELSCVNVKLAHSCSDPHLIHLLPRKESFAIHQRHQGSHLSITYQHPSTSRIHQHASLRKADGVSCPRLAVSCTSPTPTHIPSSH